MHCILLALAPIVMAAEAIDLDADTESRAKYGFDGYRYFMLLDFEDTKNQDYSMTALTNGPNDEDAVWYTAEIVWVERKTIKFESPRDCVEGVTNMEAMIQVNGQNIKAIFVCAKNGSNRLISAYVPATEEGSEYVVGQFRENLIVDVRLGKELIPFLVSGFEAKWTRFGGAPL